MDNSTCRYDVSFEIADPALAEAHFEQIQIAQNASQQIIEIMSETSGQLTDCLHLLRLPERLFDLHPLVDNFTHARFQGLVEFPDLLACGLCVAPRHQ